MKKLVLLGALVLMIPSALPAQIAVNGDFRIRAYYDYFTDTLDDRPSLNYMRYLGRFNLRAPVSTNMSIYSEFTTFTNNPTSVTRNIAATNEMFYGISQLFAEATYTTIPLVDVMRFRVGRQQFPIGNGLSQGESSYFVRLFDGVRVDMSRSGTQMSLFASVTRQSLSPSGLFPATGGDKLYIARLSRNIYGQDVMGYGIYNQIEGMFNDSYILGAGVRGSFWLDELDYFAEAAHQTFNTLPGLPSMGGYGYMAGVGHRWPMGPFRWVKIEVRTAVYQGNDESTERVERFAPHFASFFWGDRAGYVNSIIGGDGPLNGRNLEGSKIYYGRIYFVPNALPQTRIQFQYIYVDEFVDNDNYNSRNNEFSGRIFYQINRNARLQFRYVRRIPNESEFNPLLSESSANDRFSVHRYMLEWHLRF
jgi:hypothetical protein